MTTATPTKIVNTVVVDAPPELLHRACVDVDRWPLVFASVERVETTPTGAGEADGITMEMTAVNDLGRNTVRSHRRYDHARLRIDFTMSTLPPPIAAMDGHWSVRAEDGGARLDVVHNLVPRDEIDAEGVAATVRATTGRVLDELKLWVEAEHRLDLLYTEMRASTTKVSPQIFEVCELFFSRLGLCGLDWGDISMVIKDLHKRSTHEDWDDWHRRWSALGRHYELRAENAFAAGHLATGRAANGRAAACFHFAEFFYFDEPAVKNATRARVTAVFERGRRYLEHSVRPLSVPFNGHNLPGYLMTPDGIGPWPTVVMVNGLDSAKEVELQAFGASYLDRGMAVVVFDGPGQGVLSGVVPMEVRFEEVVRAVIATLADERDVDVDRIGLFGVSFGGYLAPRAAAVLDTVKACVTLSGGFDHDDYAKLNVMVQKDFKFVFRITDDDEMAELSRASLNLRGHPPLRVPLLSVHPEEDKIISFESCLRMNEWAQGETELLRYAGSRHVAPEHFAEYIPYTADWMAQRLGMAPR